jgi:subtilisin family serine protease
MSLEFNDESDCKYFAIDKVNVFTRYKKFAQVIYKQEDEKTVLGELQKRIELFKWVDWAGEAFAPTDLASAQGKSEKGFEPLFQKPVGNLTGEGVLIAILDTGVDFRHPDFITEDDKGQKKSRLVCFWDTVGHWNKAHGKRGPITYPNGDAIGVIYAQDDLNADLRDGHKPLGELDEDGHGTSCAGIAAGSGNAEKAFQGVAPKADIIAVRLTRTNPLQNDGLLCAICEWLDQFAGERPLVISCSYGGARGGRDGTIIAERLLSERFRSDRKRRLICIAAGNEGASDRHASTEFSMSEPGSIKWQAGRDGELIEIYVDGARRGDVDLQSSKVKPEEIKSYVHGISNSLVIWFKAPKGAGSVKLRATADQTLRADAYITSGLKTKDKDESSRFLEPEARNERQVGTPGTANSALAVSSYDHNCAIESQDGPKTLDYPNGEPLHLKDLSGESNHGSLRLSDKNVVKPDIAAPGQYLLGPVPDIVVQNMLKQEEQCLKNREWKEKKNSCMLHYSGKYRAFSGTSAATAYTAGVCALLLQKKKDLSMDELRKLLKENASKDEFTGDVPNGLWGYGKLDEAAVQKLAKKLR